MASGTGESTPAVSDRKKRAFDALERRFAAEAERLQEHHRQEQGKVEQTPKSEGVSGSEKRKRGYARERSFAARAEQLQESHQQGTRKAKRALNQDDDGESEQLTGVHPKLSVSASLKKDEAQPVYSELSGIVDNNLLQPVDLKAPNAIFNDIVAKGAEGNKFLKRGKSLKIDNWILLDNYVPKDGNLKDARLKAIKSHSKRSRKHMSRRQHRKCGSFDLPKEFHNFDLFEPMHEMWKEYILDLLKEAGKKQLAECLLTADLHGAFLQVVECKTTTFKGVSGIMVRETAETFGIITKDNLFRVVLKVGSVFVFQADCWKITLHGDKLSRKLLNQKNPQATR